MALKASKLRDSSVVELRNEEKELRDQIWKLRLQTATGQAQDPHKASAVRRDLARVLTVLREKTMEPSRAGAKRSRK